MKTSGLVIQDECTGTALSLGRYGFRHSLATPGPGGPAVVGRPDNVLTATADGKTVPIAFSGSWPYYDLAFDVVSGRVDLAAPAYGFQRSIDLVDTSLVTRFELAASSAHKEYDCFE